MYVTEVYVSTLSLLPEWLYEESTQGESVRGLHLPPQECQPNNASR